MSVGKFGAIAFGLERLTLPWKAREGGLLETFAFGYILIRPAGHEGTSRLSFLVVPGCI